MLVEELTPQIQEKANRAWFVKVALAALLIMGLLQAKNLSAQQPATVLEFLEVELWPDFDQPALLVLLSGALPADAPLPATITIPLPEAATINAVARIDAQGALPGRQAVTQQCGVALKHGVVKVGACKGCCRASQLLHVSSRRG